MVHINGTEWLLATANGGIWRSKDVLAQPGPHWTPVLDGQPVACTSISAMESMGSTVLAGCGGATSSEMGYDWMCALDTPPELGVLRAEHHAWLCTGCSTAATGAA